MIAVSLSVPGVVDWNLRRLQTRVASCAGVVRQVRLKPNETVARGGTVLTFESEIAIAAQERFIGALLALEAESDAARVAEVRSACRELTRLKFTKNQIKRIEQTRRVLRQLPIVSAWGGLVVQVCTPGGEVEIGAPLFAIATEKVVLCTAPEEASDEELQQLRVARDVGASHERWGDVRIERDDRAGRWVYFDFVWPNGAPPIGARVEVKLPPPPPPTPPPPLVRGLEWRLQRHAEDPSYPVVPGPAPRRLSPEDAERNAQRLALRAQWRVSSINVELPEARRLEAAAPDLVFGDDAWRDQAIETALVREVVMAPAWRALTIVETIRPEKKRLQVRAPCDGWCEPGGVEAGQVLEVGALLARVRPDADAAAWRPPDMKSDEGVLQERDLVAVRAVRDELHVVLQQRCLVRTPPSRGLVKAGAALGTLHAVPWPALRCIVPADTAAGVPARVRVRVAVAGEKTIVSECVSAVLRAPARRSGETLLYAPLPDCAAGWQPGAAYDVTLADDTAARTVLAAPVDCIAHLGQATEVLAHTGRGRLTRRTVTVGAAQDGLVEIVAGLVAGDALVRQLEARMKWFPRFMAAMVGVWPPAHQETALLRSVDER